MAMAKPESWYIKNSPEYNKVCRVCKTRFNSLHRSRIYSTHRDSINCSPECSHKYIYFNRKEKERLAIEVESLLNEWMAELGIPTIETRTESHPVLPEVSL